MWIPLTIFVVTYLVISGQRLPGVRLDRPSGALCGAVAMVLSGTLTELEAYRSINLETIALLFGMMIVSAYLVEANFFRNVAAFTIARVRTARSLLVGVVALTGLASAVLVNDTVCVTLAPVVLAVVRATGLPPLPYLLALTTAANIAGVMTLTGNPQNMIIATLGQLSYPRYFLRMLPVGIGGLALDAALLIWLFRRELPHGELPPPPLDPPPLDRPLLGKTLGVLAVVIAGFFTGQSIAGMALVGAALLTLIARTAPRPVFARVDGSLLLFFAGLFVVIEGATRTGVLDRLHHLFQPWLGTSPAHQLVSFGLFSVVASNVLSNVPFVLTAKTWVTNMAQPELQWTGLAMTSTLAGNLTIVGSVANVIVLELAGADGHVGFWRFVRYGGLITLATVGLGFAVILIELRFGL